jgi:hypothetical protein
MAGGRGGEPRLDLAPQVARWWLADGAAKTGSELFLVH